MATGMRSRRRMFASPGEVIYQYDAARRKTLSQAMMNVMTELAPASSSFRRAPISRRGASQRMRLNVSSAWRVR
jgi:hypothetical protein